MSYLLKIGKIYYLLFIVSLYVILNIVFNHVFMSESFVSQWYEGVLSQIQIQEAISFFSKWEWTMIIFNIILIFIKILSVSACLYIGTFFFLNQNNPYKIYFNITLKAEIVFVCVFIVRILWLRFINLPESLAEIHVWPLSLMYFFNPETIEPWLIYPLNTLNVFELLYICMLSALMAVVIKIKFRKAFDLVFMSYGAGLLLLMVAQMFLILNNS